jgi:alcohol dehydrogenase class IV
VADSFEFDYFGSDIVYGRGSVERLGAHLESEGLERALIICGTNVGANEEVMQPVIEGLGKKPVGVFDKTTPAKKIENVYDGIEMMQEVNADVLIGVGGGSSLDMARQISVYDSDGGKLEEYRTAVLEGNIKSLSSNESATPVVTIPTTFAGAGISDGGSVEIVPIEASPKEYPLRLRSRLMPVAMFYDPNLFETTPDSALNGSAMNGFNKGIETLYARNANPLTDAPAIHGLRLLHNSLPKLPGDSTALNRAVVGIILVQFQRKISLIHSIGHAFSHRYPVQQGTVHAIVVPHALEFIFDRFDANRALLAEGLNVDADAHSDSELAEAIIDKVVAVRDSLNLPTCFRELEGVGKSDIPSLAEYVCEDIPADRIPREAEPTVDEIKTLLHKAW